MSDITPHEAWEQGFRPNDPLEMMPPGSSPGGIFVRVVDATTWTVLSEHAIDRDVPEDTATQDAMLALGHEGEVRVFLYDGDSGECIGTLIKG